MRLTLLAAGIAASLSLLGLAAPPASADAGETTSVTGTPACAQGIASDQDGNWIITWTGITSNVPAHDVGTVHVDALFVDGQQTGTAAQVPPVAPDAGYQVRQIRVAGWASSAGISGHVDWAPAIDPDTGLPYADGDTATAPFSANIPLDGSCTVHPVDAPAFVEQAGCTAPGQYSMRAYSRVVYTVNGRSDSTATAGVHLLPLNYASTVTVAAFDNVSHAALGSWSHTFVPTALSRCVNPATVHYTASVACSTVTVHASVDPGGVPTVLDINDLVYGLPLAYADFTVQPGASVTYVYRLTPASRPAAPDTVIVSIYSQHSGVDHPLTLSVPHLCTAGVLQPMRSPRTAPVAAARPVLAVTGGAPRLAGLLGLALVGVGGLLVRAARGA